MWNLSANSGLDMRGRRKWYKIELLTTAAANIMASVGSQSSEPRRDALKKELDFRESAIPGTFSCVSVFHVLKVNHEVSYHISDDPKTKTGAAEMPLMIRLLLTKKKIQKKKRTSKGNSNSQHQSTAE